MSEARIGRVLVASLHQAIADLLPNRLEFYENWLTTCGLREGTIGLAPLSAVLSFLRREGEAYRSDHGARRRVRGGLDGQRYVLVRAPDHPRRCRRGSRARAALRTAASLVRTTYPGSRAIFRFRRGTASVDLRGSLFCEVREASVLPLCGFYAAAIAGCCTTSAFVPKRR